MNTDYKISIRLRRKERFSDEQKRAGGIGGGYWKEFTTEEHGNY